MNKTERDLCNVVIVEIKAISFTQSKTTASTVGGNQAVPLRKLVLKIRDPFSGYNNSYYRVRWLLAMMSLNFCCKNILLGACCHSCNLQLKCVYGPE